MNIEKFNTVIFDCDGVVLDANQVKTQAFYNIALPYGKSAAKALTQYHVQHGGISRYHKLQFFLDNILGDDTVNVTLDELLTAYANEVHHGLLHCKVAEGLIQLKAKIPRSRWLIVSGGDQCELRKLFTQRKLIQYFDGGIFGSPDNKDQILDREMASGNIMQPSLFIGDSQYDHQAAVRAGLDFMFVSQWTEFAKWQEYCAEHRITIIESLETL